MYQIDNDTSSLNLPTPTAANRPGFFVDGDPAKGLAATILPAEFMNMLMMEFINLLKAANITPSKSDYTQLSQAIPVLISRLATVDWSQVKNIPANLVYLNSAPTFAGAELYSSNPYIDFHYNNDASDYNMRIMNTADNTLSIMGKASGLLMNFGPGLVAAFAPLYATKGLNIYSQGASSSVAFMNSTGGKLDYCIQYDDNTFNVLSYPDGSAGVAALSLVRATGQFFFGLRPTFAGATPWDSSNFNPASKANVGTTLSAYGITDAVSASTYTAGINSLTGSLNATNSNVAANTSSISATNASLAQTNSNVAAANAAIATKQPNLGFTPVRQGGGAGQLNNGILIGFDGTAVRVQVDNTDFGRILSDANYTGYFPAGMASVGIYGVGSYGLFCYAPGTALNPGVVVPGSSLHASPTSGYLGYASPPGTWICCGSSIGSGNTNSTTVFQRIS